MIDTEETRQLAEQDLLNAVTLTVQAVKRLESVGLYGIADKVATSGEGLANAHIWLLQTLSAIKISTEG